MDGVKRPCPAGRYGITEGLTDPGCTAQCPDGYVCGVGEANYTRGCPQGFWCANATQNPCPLGRYGEFIGYTNATNCTQCPAGKFNDREAGYVAQRLQPCVCLHTHTLVSSCAVRLRPLPRVL